MKSCNGKVIILSILSTSMVGCDFDKEIKSLEVKQSEELILLGTQANVSFTSWIQSEKDNWNLTQVNGAQVSMNSIGAVLINNNGERDTADVQVSGNGSGMYMIKSDSPLNLEKYSSGYIAFKIRPKSAFPSSFSVSIDNEWPNRSSLQLSNILTESGKWASVTIPVNCMKPVDGATEIDLKSVATPFHLDVKEKFDYEITDIIYKLKEEKPTIDPVSCDVAKDSDTPAEVIPSLQTDEVALYYFGNKNGAQDLSEMYPVNSFGANVENTNQIVHAAFSQNGGVFLGKDDANSDLSNYSENLLAIDLNISSYGDSDNIQLRIDGSSVDFGRFMTIDKSLIPEGSAWHRCHFPISSLIPIENLSSVNKAIYLSGVWDSMNGLDFSFTNVAIKKIPSDFDASRACEEIK
ncbi:hypothetical protein EA26_10775 [Vibrio navarrensis]|uniref:ExoP galactose-binding-like domain-containing protein n=2 Tax=Vibrio navarrensis TaxID=29495 RepID=A0A099LWF6_9VIBR|nr:putative glycoside hydrolase [Vibrio navarrensis]KGK11761.1 hypothetical protein EA26_10775 [Vibrio navarrensis]QOD67733.1 hypothetical protein IF132_04700 [Vibrio navarrensis]